MTAISCVRLLGFDAGHRVYGHEGKCAHLHGHRYKVELHARGESGLDALGRVVDFSVLKERVGGWIDANWDHGLILYGGDPMAEVLSGTSIPGGAGATQKLYVLGENPTAENLAKHLLERIIPPLMLGSGCDVIRVVLWETPNCFAVAEF